MRPSSVEVTSLLGPVLVPQLTDASVRFRAMSCELPKQLLTAFRAQVQAADDTGDSLSRCPHPAILSLLDQRRQLHGGNAARSCERSWRAHFVLPMQTLANDYDESVGMHCPRMLDVRASED